MEKILLLLKSDTFKQFIKYAFVGLSGLIIEMCLFYIFVKILDIHYFFTDSLVSALNNAVTTDSVNTSTSHIISSIVAITNNFILNRYFTFKVKDNKAKRFFSFFGIALVGLVISTSLLHLFNSILGEDLIMVSKIFAIGIVVMFQFVFNKFFTFKEETAKE